VKIVLLSLALVVAACSPGAESSDARSVTGVVVDVESTGLNEVTSFELRADDATTTIYIDEDVEYGFPLGHLNAHMTSAEPVRVETDDRDGRLYAQSIEDV
jgi:hypothetical protein